MAKAKKSNSKISASIMDLVTPVNRLKEKYDEVLEEVSKSAQKVIAAEVKSLLHSVPELESIVWRQYTPGFNDGDPCVFEVHSLNFVFKCDIKLNVFKCDIKLNETGYDAGEEVDIYSSEIEISAIQKSGESKPVDGQAILDFMQSFGLISHDLLLNAFGDGHEIKVTRSGFDITEYYE